jgi:hypothetical protein
MDGYAVRYEDVKDTNPENPVTLKIIAEIPAGKVPEKIIQPGEAGNYYFVFISGAFDWNFGGALGATLNVTDVKIQKAGTY